MKRGDQAFIKNKWRDVYTDTGGVYVYLNDFSKYYLAWEKLNSKHD